MPWLTRAFLLLVAAVAIAGAGCTRYGKPTPVPPTIPPLTTLVVNPMTGSDTAGNGTSEKPYKTLTKALNVVKNSTTTGLTIQLAPGQYTAANGEVFPIVVPTGVTIDGSGYTGQTGFPKGSFINGIGEDTALEKLAGFAPQSAYTTLEIGAGVTSVSLNNIYAGVSRFGTLNPRAAYSTLDALGSLSIGHAALGAGTLFKGHPNGTGIAVPSGDLTCIGCAVTGGAAALVAYTLPNGASPPLVVLSGQPTQGIIGGSIGILTDGYAGITASYQTFQSKQYAFSDKFPALVASSGSFGLSQPDFGNAPNTASPGGNSFIGVGISGMLVTLPLDQVYAEGDYWTPDQQGANVHGQYSRKRVFSAGASGKNVTIASGASGAAVTVGPIPPPTPTPQPSTSPSTSPSASPT